MAVHRATAADGRRLRSIQAAALDEPWPALLDPRAPIDPQLWVIEDPPSGYAAVLTAAAPAAHLAELAIVPERHGEGLGSALLEAVATDLAAEGYERLRLTTPADEPRLRRFYERHGFDRRQRLPDRFSGRDGLLLERPLTPGGQR